MAVVFDPDKDTTNRRKHGLSLARAEDLTDLVVILDDRKDYGEPRFRGFGFIDGKAHCLAFTIRGNDIRAISLRRARSKEIKRYGKKDETDPR